MAESFTRWESDPLFSAAEVVQDSADRMESLYRTLMHEQNVVPESPSKHQISVQYHKRDLTTALETTRWQLEDFEREVNLAALSDESKSRENALLKHRHFIRAIRELILQVERSVLDSTRDVPSRNPTWVNLNEQEKDMLTSFLSGGNSGGHVADYDTTGTSIMTRFLNTNTDNNEIVEVEPAEDELLVSVNGYDKNGRVVVNGYAGQEEAPGAYDLEFGGSAAKSYPYNKRTRGSIWEVLRRFWLKNSRISSLTKRRKDGEITDLMETSGERMPSSMGIITPDQQGTILECLISTIQRRFQRSRYPSLHNLFSVRFGSAILVLLIIIGFYMFWVV